MITLPKALLDKFDSWLEREAVDVRRHAEYRRWLLYFSIFVTNTGMDTLMN